MDSAPLRIECVDISHVQGTDVVASLVVFEDGLPRKSDYRHYSIRRPQATALRRRRLDRRGHPTTVPASSGRREQPEALDPQTGRPRKFAYPPNLFIVDGGAPSAMPQRRSR